MAMCVIAVVAVAPCQCFSPGGIQTTSPGRISSLGPPSRCAHPQPAVTISVWPSGCVCHAVRAPGSKVTLAPATCDCPVINHDLPTSLSRVGGADYNLALETPGVHP